MKTESQSGPEFEARAMATTAEPDRAAPHASAVCDGAESTRDGQSHGLQFSSARNQRRVSAFMTRCSGAATGPSCGAAAYSEPTSGHGRAAIVDHAIRGECFKRSPPNQPRSWASPPPPECAHLNVHSQDCRPSHRRSSRLGRNAAGWWHSRTDASCAVCTPFRADRRRLRRPPQSPSPPSPLRS